MLASVKQVSGTSIQRGPRPSTRHVLHMELVFIEMILNHVNACGKEEMILTIEKTMRTNLELIQESQIR